MMKRIDLHIHTTASDGTLSPEEVARQAKELGLAAIAITDHDTAAGAAQAAELSARYDIEVIPGIEISADYQGLGVHIIGYFIDPASPHLAPVLEHIIAERTARNRRIVALMRADGLDVSLEAMEEKYPGTVIGRPHFARELMERGLCDSVAEGFQRYLNRGKVYYRARCYLPLDVAFRAIREAGGKAVLAHPLQYRLSDAELEALTACLTGHGCVGMECLYSGYTAEQSAALMALAARYGLCVTGGSDFHGSGKAHIRIGSGTGDLCVPYVLLERLKNI